MKKDGVFDSDIYRRYCRDYSYDECPIYRESSSSSGGCYLTSACINAKNLADNCLDLAVLRDFRDNWLSKQPEGQNEIAKYYSIAPKIVDAINDRSDANDLWSGIYNNVVRHVSNGSVREIWNRHMSVIVAQHGIWQIHI